MDYLRCGGGDLLGFWGAATCGEWGVGFGVQRLRPFLNCRPGPVKQIFVITLDVGIKKVLVLQVERHNSLCELITSPSQINFRQQRREKEPGLTKL